MRNPVVRARADDQEIIIQQDGGGRGKLVDLMTVRIAPSMVPKLVADLMSAAVALGVNIDYPPPNKITMQ